MRESAFAASARDRAPRQCARVGEAAQRCAAGSRPRQRLAVDVDAPRVIEELRARIEPHTRASCARQECPPRHRLPGRREIDRRFRLGEQHAQETVDVRGRPADVGEHRRAAALHRGIDPCGLAGGAKVGIRVAAVEREAIAQPVEKRDRELVGGGRAKPDRICHAWVDRHAVVRERRRQIEHVAWAENGIVSGTEAAREP